MRVCLDLGVPKDMTTSEFVKKITPSDAYKINFLLDVCEATTLVLGELRNAGINASIVTDEGDSDGESFGGADTTK